MQAAAKSESIAHGGVRIFYDVHRGVGIAYSRKWMQIPIEKLSTLSLSCISCMYAAIVTVLNTRYIRLNFSKF